MREDFKSAKRASRDALRQGQKGKDRVRAKLIKALALHKLGE